MIGFSDNRYRDVLFTHAPVGIAYVDPQGRFLEVNDAFCKYTGYSESELKTMKFQAITEPRDLQGDLTMIQKLREREADDYTMTKRYITKQGKTFWATIYVKAIRKFDGELDHFISHVLPLPNGGKFKVEEENGKVIVKPTPDLKDLIMDNKKVTLGVVLMFLWSIADKLKENFILLIELFK